MTRSSIRSRLLSNADARQRVGQTRTGGFPPLPTNFTGARQLRPARWSEVGGEGRVRTSVATRAAGLQPAAIDRSATSPNLVLCRASGVHAFCADTGSNVMESWLFVPCRSALSGETPQPASRALSGKTPHRRFALSGKTPHRRFALCLAKRLNGVSL